MLHLLFHTLLDETPGVLVTVQHRPGGWTRYNMEAGPPMFAPLLASLVGGMGLVAAVLRRERFGRP